MRYLLNKCVFSLDLNDATVSQSLMWYGSWFHVLGPFTLKALSANVLHLVGGTCSWSESF